MPEQLPPELFDDIFFYLRASEDFASLYAFTEINDFFHTLAEPHLYYHFTLSDHDLYDDSTVIVTQNSIFAGHSPLQVLNLLTDKPHIVTRGYVRSLKLLIEAETNYGGIMDTERRRRWSDDIARLIAPLTSLECVTMSQQGMGMLLWRQFSRDLQVAFGNMLNLPSLWEVEICYLGLPLEVLCRSAMLKRLRLSGSNVSFGTHGQGVSPRTPENQRASLSALNFRHTNYPSIVSWLESGIGPDISRLQYLKATLEVASDYQHVSYMLSLCSSSLIHLALDPGNTGLSTCSSLLVLISLITRARIANLRYKVIARGQTVVMEPPLSRYPFSSSPLFPSSFDAASLSGPFSLSCLSSLKHLELCLEMSGFSSFGRAYTAPFHLSTEF
ncbi:hypothetical protein CVT26_006995 [Gymnopilus dilepis]|uniref:F-box domain-containing protein n=1 Tax=Gymnopilus dilepis TaxID=231916 RepID=A0A409W162_9AGAR|nr:hypothetical protein CVT26_006995 [Gymnopilus dilepis]